MLFDRTRVVRGLNLTYHGMAVGRPVGCCSNYGAGAAALFAEIHAGH